MRTACTRLRSPWSTPGAALLVALACFASPAADAQAQGQRVFRCVVNGKVSFQQRACSNASTTKVLEVRPGAAPHRVARRAAPAPAVPR